MSVGGITAGDNNIIKNCINYGNVKGEYYAGGISSGHGNNPSTIINCINYGNIESKNGGTGGIIGKNATSIENCINLGKIKGIQYVGGISGNVEGGTIKNCINFTAIEPLNWSCDIIAYSKVKNFQKCYYNSDNVKKGMEIDKNLIDIKGKSMNEIVNLLNSYTDETGKYPSEWKKWKIGEDGYPTFK